MRVALAVVALGAATALGQEVFHADDARKWGTPRRVLPPQYPREALEKRHTGYVDMEGVVTPLTTLEVFAYTPDSEASRVFVEPLKEAVKYWTFYSSVGDDCQPSGEKTVTRVWFELDGEKPKISVSTPAHEARPAPSRLDPVERPAPRYPDAGLRAGLQAYVYARMAVDRAGAVTEVTSTAYPKNMEMKPFVRATESALRAWRFPPSDRELRVVCKEVFYRLTN